MYTAEIFLLVNGPSRQTLRQWITEDTSDVLILRSPLRSFRFLLPLLRIPAMDHTSGVHSDPYLDDGNVVLAARTVDGACHVFRVHRSLLCRQSGIFADMFAVAAPTDPSAHEMYAGASLVRMPDDAKDLGDLLKMMYDPSCVLAVWLGLRQMLMFCVPSPQPIFPASPQPARAVRPRGCAQTLHEVRNPAHPFPDRRASAVRLAADFGGIGPATGGCGGHGQGTSERGRRDRRSISR